MTSPRLEIRVVDDDASWDAFVEPRAVSALELAGWRHVVRDVYGIESRAWAAVEHGAWVGAMALFSIRHPLFGRYVVSVPFGTDGGLIADTPAAGEALARCAVEYCDEVGAAYALIRTRHAPLDGFVSTEHYVTAVKSLDGNEDALWHEGFGFKTRNHIRKAKKGGFELAWGREQLEPFCDVFQRHMRDLGSPAHGPSFYRAIARHLGERARFLVARRGGRCAAGALVLTVNDIAANLHTVALRRYARDCVNYLVYWEMLRRLQADGFRSFDMGRSLVDGPNLRFKRNWRVEQVPLFYNFHLRTITEPPFLDPRHPRLRAAIAIWRRLPPALTRALGPRLIRGLA